jgi:trehalose synthase-fused probable maltokinase
MQLTTWIERHLSERLPAFLMGQRWFGSKARTIAQCACHDLAPIPGGAPLALVLIRVKYADGGEERYAMVVAAVDEPSGRPVIGEFDGTGWVIEAGTLPEAVGALLQAFSHETLPTVRGGTVARLVTAPAAATALAALSAAAVQPLGAEQSNTSIRLERRYVFKLFRKLEAEENPEVEIGRFLSGTAFRDTPRLRGAWTYRAADGGAATIGVLQDWVENQGDGWSYALNRLSQLDVDILSDLEHQLAGLGETTAAMHAALASADASAPAFAPAAATPALAQTWRAGLAGEATRALARLRTTPPGDTAARALAARIAADETRLTAIEPPAIDNGGAFDTIRIHGDYHLGQTLKTSDGFVVIDFEGEPARPIAERRQRHAAMKDVAGMLRSFDYAVAIARARGYPEVKGRDALAVMRDAFLGGYVRRAVAGGARFVPRRREAFDAWVAFFELEKVLYEVDYELNQRPDWVHIPLGGLARLLDPSP